MIESREQQLQSILHAYLQAIDRCEKPDRQAILDAHPVLRDELAEYFADASKLDRMAKSLKTASFGGDGVVSPSLGKVRYFGDYELLEEIARGGMGVVFKAKQVSLNRIVAVKMILKGELASEADVRRFRQEAEAAANLDHPNIVPIYEVGEHEGQQYFSMKLIERGERKAGLRETAEMAAKVARAVHHAHQRGILHRDLKPSNVLIDKNGEPNVADFGLAKKVAGGDDATKSGAIVGTPAYMAPEQARAEKTLTTAVDVWSLGAILYEWLTGRPPFRGEDTISTLLKVASEEPTPLRKTNPKIERDLETICLKCLQKEPAKRYRSAEALADDLDRWLRGDAIEARPINRIERTWRWSKRHPTAAIVILAAIAVFAILVGNKIEMELHTRAQNVARATSGMREGRERAAKDFDSNRFATGMAWLSQALEFAIRLDDREAEKRIRIDLEQASRQVPVLRSVLTALQPKDQPFNWGDGRALHVVAALSADGQYAALTLDADPSGVRLGLFELATGKRLAAINAKSEPAVAFSPDRKQLLVGLPFEAIRLYEVPSMKLVGSIDEVESRLQDNPRFFRNQFHSPLRVGFSPNGKLIYAFINNPGVWCQFWERETLKPTVAYYPNERNSTWVIHDLDFSPDGKLAAFSTDFGIRCWNLETGKYASPILQLGLVTNKKDEPALWKNVKSLAFHPDGKSIFGMGEAHFGEWKVETGEIIDKIQPPQSPHFFRLSSDGTRLVAYALESSYKDAASLWNPWTRERLNFDLRFSGHIQEAAFHPKSQWLLLVGRGIGLSVPKIEWFDTATSKSAAIKQVIPQTSQVMGNVPLPQKKNALSRGLRNDLHFFGRGVLLAKDCKSILEVQPWQARLWEIIPPEGPREEPPPAFPKNGSIDQIRSWIAAVAGIGIGEPQGVADAGARWLWDQPYALDHEAWSAARARWVPEK